MHVGILRPAAAGLRMTCVFYLRRIQLDFHTQQNIHLAYQEPAFIAGKIEKGSRG
jgi:hypothetical protein